MANPTSDSLTIPEAQAEALRLSFAPLAFQAARVMRDTNLLELLHQHAQTGLTLDELATHAQLPRYGVKVLLEAGLGIGLVTVAAERFTITKIGYFILRDPITRINMDFAHHLCYRGFFHLEEAIRTGEPAGLKTFGDWKRIYEGLSSLPADAQRSWFTFDHFYSDGAFPATLPIVFADRPRRLLDVGGNTGRWAVQCTQHDPAVHITIADLPEQLALARNVIRENNLADRITCHALNLLDETQPLPAGHDVIWMSQFLCCFSDAEVISILRRARQAMGPAATLYILDTYWDRQPTEIATYCIQQTSLYFTCMANGRSQMRPATDILRCLAASGLHVETEYGQVGRYHTLFKCRPA